MAEIVGQCWNHFNAAQLTEPFQQKVPLVFERGGFRIKTIDSARELEAVLRLRYDVFHREFRNKKFPVGMDLETLDFVADHLAVWDLKTNRPVGTYRLISSSFSDHFYSQEEFHIDTFLGLSGTKLELSRACIRREFRTGTPMNLLWRGLSLYLRKVEASFLFGCASVKTVDSRKVGGLVAGFHRERLTTEAFDVRPLETHVLPGLSISGIDTVEQEIPALLKAYFKAGAKVCPAPALDRVFKCVDFFTVLDLKSITSVFQRRYEAT